MIQRCVLAHEKSQSCIFSSAFDGIIARHILACLGWMNNQLAAETGAWGRYWSLAFENYSSPERKLIPEVYEGNYSLNLSLFEGQAYHSSPQYSKNLQTLDSLITRSGLTPIAE